MPTSQLWLLTGGLVLSTWTSPRAPRWPHGVATGFPQSGRSKSKSKGEAQTFMGQPREPHDLCGTSPGARGDVG